MPAAACAVQSALALMAGAWSTQSACTVLDTGFSDGALFLASWRHWQSLAQRPAMLHYVGVLSLDEALALPAGLSQSFASSPLAELASELALQCYDLEPGFHRLLLQDGQVSLTLCVGEVGPMLARQDLQADTLVAGATAQAWDKWQIKALARCCKRGSQLLFHGPHRPKPALLTDAGFALAAAGAPGSDADAGADDGAPLHAVYAPRWQLRADRDNAPSPGLAAAAHGTMPRRCAVIGAGIAGASVAHALALRGLHVDVYDRHAQAAGGASGLPVGLVVPHHSLDDSPRSRLSRQGTRLMLQHASRLLQTAQDWGPGGVFERSLAHGTLKPEEADMLSQPATHTPHSGWAKPMDFGEGPGLWHPHAAWIKPARLVQAWLSHPDVALHTGAAVHTLEREQDSAQGAWLLRDAQGQTMGRADTVVFANAFGSAELLQRLALHQEALQPGRFHWVPDVLAKLQALHTMHGTLSHGPCPAPPLAAPRPTFPVFPAFPVNGHGSFVSGVPTAQGPQWVAGSTFEPDAALHADVAREQDANFQKLQTLLPAVAQMLQPQFASHTAQTWQGSRCITHDRLPLVGPLDDGNTPTLWLCAGMGARGLSFSALCAELLAAWMGGEPLPIESNLARSLSTQRPRRKRAARAQAAAD